MHELWNACWGKKKTLWCENTGSWNSVHLIIRGLCVSGESRGPETPAASLLWEESLLSLTPGPRRAAAGQTDWGERIKLIFTLFTDIWLSVIPPFVRPSWVCAMFWRLTPTSYTCGILPPLAHCFTLPVPNCRGRCWPSCALTSLSDQAVTASAVVRPPFNSSFCCA